MPSDIRKPLMIQVPVRSCTRHEAERIAAYVMTGFIMVLKIAGYRFRLSADKGGREREGNYSGYSGICSGTERSRGSEVENLQIHAQRVSPAIL